MTPEGQRPSDTGNTLFLEIAGIAGIFLLSQLAFSLKVRKEIGKRDRWHCADCGVQWWDGSMLQASHYNHDKKSPDYDKPESGRLQCVDCHQAYHELHVGSASEIGLTEQANLAAIALLEATERFHK